MIQTQMEQYLRFLERELLDGFVLKGGATCRFVESEAGPQRSEFQASLSRLALSKGMILAETELTSELPLHDWKQLTNRLLQCMYIELDGKRVRSLPSILAALSASGGLNTDPLLQAKLPHAGFRNAMWWACQGERHDAVSSYLLGEKVSAAALKEAGLTGVKGTLTQKNAERVLQTVLAGLGLLGVPGTLLLWTEGERHLAGRGQRPTEKLRIAANLIRRLVDGCTMGVLNRSLVCILVQPGFLERCADAYPAVGQRLQIVQGGLQRPAWRFPIAPLRQLASSGGGATNHPAPVAPDEKRYEAQRSLESLRFGLVPRSHVERLTIGYPELRGWMESSLPEAGEPKAHLVTGPFGTGKSHAMELLRYVAEERNYLYARVELDGQSASLSEPGLLFQTMCRNLQFPKETPDLPVLALFEKAIARGHNVLSFPSKGMPWVKASLETVQLLKRSGQLEEYGFLVDSALTSGEEYAAGEAARELADASGLRATHLRLKPPVGGKPEVRPREWMEAFAGLALLSRLAGYSGILLAVDEFEVETHIEPKRFDRTIGLLSELLRYMEPYAKGQAAGDVGTAVPPAPLAVYFSTVGMNTTGDAFLERLVALAGGTTYRLNHWTDHQRMELASRLYELYAKAYDMSEPYDERLSANVNQLLRKHGLEGSTLIRAFVKWYLGVLDMKYGPPGTESK
ncbi:BREX system ATP-binding domain-containing protein [Paenibacillus sp.]|uniref:BREX system ATP-binding domain-containing protein n=1 Tax=Paenibacillus sp. TaxID=58172 RepID=UPI0028110378|nr:BREX system ATP-binding domain-containing protein [Paenibacillus sp.]